ncbi:MAG: ParB/RepB/Spo0J family partition protein [Sphaerochaeta sp.]|nr:ParB/RepB/Spo0J family partition protein [Sphaerochaeta sp.]MCH3919604.1 ParB/RepB/Spo0J family partition protein [Sphaerochaeta sp.]MCI2044863.1 ParB/RepB/Spo0J family partition protein [Sphaerochaeta sp.]MCI2075900.1 ParB/RepB/Spo0J family partition protein [Sphaerochaeta sp.]MCI2104953.1 ParB/RepB/Spo0J family partition protein [Sphaerochaeta sp.]
MSLKQMNTPKKHGLGKGIESLLDDYSFNAAVETTIGAPVKEAEPEGERIIQVPVAQIRPNPNQPRKTFDEAALKDLALSIKNQGVISPIIVEKISETEYSIVAGERRYRAAKIAGLTTVPVLVKTLSDIQRMEVSLIENIQRQNLNPLEEAKAYAYLLNEAGITQEELSRRVGKDRTTITNSLRLLQLPANMQADLLAGKFSAGQARAILSVVNPADRDILYHTVLEKELSVRATEQLAAEFNKGKRVAYQKKKRVSKSLAKSPDVISVEDKFLHIVGTRVEVQGSLERGKIEIPYTSSEELERIYQLFKPDDELFDV